MTSWSARALGWTADLEDDLADPATLRVFVPSIMGAGILASLAVLLADVVRAVNPRSRAARRRAAMRRRALALVVPLAEAIGLPAPALPPLRRRLRSRRSYTLLAVVSVSLSIYVAIGSTANYFRAGGYLEGVLWIEVLALSAAAFFLFLGVLAAALALRHPTPPKWTRGLVDHTALGVVPE